MLKQFCISIFFVGIGFLSYSQCETLTFAELGYEPAHCRTANYQTGNGVVYAAATGGTPDYDYQWINLQTGQIMTFSTTLGGLNPGEYQIKVTDNIGCVITAIIKVDSVIPIADFTISSVDLDTNWMGINSAEVTILNTSQNWGSCWGCAINTFPLVDSIHFMQVDGGQWEFMSLEQQESVVFFDDIGYHQVCVAVTNNNQCTDTICKTVTITLPVISQPFINITTSSVTGDFFIELLLPYPVVLNLYDFSGAPISTQNVIPGFNTFNFTTGQYIYDVVDPVLNQVIASGTFFVL